MADHSYAESSSKTESRIGYTTPQLSYASVLGMSKPNLSNHSNCESVRMNNLRFGSGTANATCLQNQQHQPATLSLTPLLNQPVAHIFATHDQTSEIYGSASGKQCMAIAYCALAHNIHLKTVDNWRQSDLDAIMFKGSEIYKEHKPSGHMYFSSDELPSTVNLRNKRIISNQVFGEDFSGYIFGRDMSQDHATLLHSVQSCISKDSSNPCFICTIGEFSVAIMKTKTGVFVLDSHKRDSNGKPSGNGKAVLLKFVNESIVCHYIVSMYPHLSRGTPLPYELCLFKFSAVRRGSTCPRANPGHTPNVNADRKRHRLQSEDCDVTKKVVRIKDTATNNDDGKRKRTAKPQVFVTKNNSSIVVTAKKNHMIAKSISPMRHTPTVTVNKSKEEIDIILNSVQKHSSEKVCTDPSLDLPESTEQPVASNHSDNAKSLYNAARRYHHSSFEQPYIVGGMSFRCSFCNAHRFVGETDSICCSGGKVKICMSAKYPDAIKTLLSGDHKRSKHFLQHIRQYNSAFQMTSFGCSEDKIPGWQPTFRIKGQIHHRIGSLFTESDERPVYCQIYFIEDAEQQVEQRTMYFDNLDKNILSDIQNILHQHNRYVTAFKTAVEILTENNASEMQLVLSASKRPHGTHERRFNLPCDSELGVLMPNDVFNNRDIVLRTRNVQ